MYGYKESHNDPIRQLKRPSFDTEFLEFSESVKKDIKEFIMTYVNEEPDGELRERLSTYINRKSHFRRPINLMLVGMALGAERERLLPLASVIQLSEEWILMLDDLMDRSSARRGAQTYSMLYGDSNTINDATMLHAMMWKMLFDYASMLSESDGTAKAAKVVGKFYEIGMRTYEGQSLDINMLKDAGSIGKLSADDYIRLAELKTAAYTVWGPLQLGAIVAGASESVIDALRRIGEPAGVAFQIYDDLKDLTATEVELGKERFGDIYESKPTLIIIRTYELATDEERARIDEIYAKKRPDKTEGDIGYINSIIAKYGAIEYAMRIAGNFAGMAATELSRFYSSSEVSSSIKERKYIEWFIEAISTIF